MALLMAQRFSDYFLGNADIDLNIPRTSGYRWHEETFSYRVEKYHATLFHT